MQNLWQLIWRLWEICTSNEKNYEIGAAVMDYEMPWNRATVSSVVNMPDINFYFVLPQ